MLNTTVFHWLQSLRPALPFSVERPLDSDGRCVPMSNAELRRHVQQGAVLVNGERIAADEPLDFPVFSLVFFPKSAQRKTTVI